MAESTVILIDDEPETREATAQVLELAGMTTLAFDTAERALETISFAFDGVVVSDIRMPGMDGMSLMQEIKSIDPAIPVVLITGHADVQLAVRAMKEGAYDFLEKPFDPDLLIEIIARAISHRHLVIENRMLRNDLSRTHPLDSRLTGRSAPMQKLRDRIRAIAPTETDVLIQGDTGTGKELVSRLLHDLSPRAGKPFVTINCAALPIALLENELFGHEAGAFPGAFKSRFGKLEHGQGGTIVLDEIGSMHPETQAKLLRVLEDRTVTRLGSNEAYKLNVRFIATSRVDLIEAVERGEFRSDLLYRLNVTTIHVPPLSERPEDIPLLFLRLVEEANLRHQRQQALDPSIATAMMAKDWPGNVRELRNAAERYVLFADVREDLADHATDPGTLAARMDAVERKMILGALAAHSGNLKDVYEALGLSRRTLYDKMRRYDLRREDYLDDLS